LIPFSDLVTRLGIAPHQKAPPLYFQLSVPHRTLTTTSNHIPFTSTSPHPHTPSRSITLHRPSLLTRTLLDTNSANLSFFYRRNTVGNLNGQNDIRTTAAQISTSFVRCIKGGLCRSRSKNTSGRRRPSCQILRPRCCKPLMSSIHVLVCEPRAYIPSSSVSIVLALCINQTSKLLSYSN
jgi:hypothetical protein